MHLVLVAAGTPLAEQAEDQGKSIPAALQEPHLPRLFAIIHGWMRKTPQQQRLRVSRIVNPGELRDDRRVGVDVNLPFFHLVFDGPLCIAASHLRHQRMCIARIG